MLIPNGTTSDSWNSGWSASQQNAWANANGFSSSMGSGRAASAQSIQNAAEANAINNANMERMMAYNAQQAQIQRDWEEEMSNTAYQRSTKDLIAAGLNPILAVTNGGASTPTGYAASTNALQASMAREYTDYEAENRSESGSEARSESKWSGGSHSESNISEQIKAGIEALGDAIGNLKGNSSTAEKLKDFKDTLQTGLDNTEASVRQQWQDLKDVMEGNRKTELQNPEYLKNRAF